MLVVVLAHYNEDLSWRRSLRMPSVVCSKTLPDADLYLPVNKGHEALCYLRYIITHYDDLPEHVCFLHAHADSDHQEYPSALLANGLRLDGIEYANLNRRDWYTDFRPDGEYAAEYQWLATFWREVAQPCLGVLPAQLGHYASAQFVVSHARITARPVEFYQACYDWIVSTEMPNYQSGRVFERCWHVIMGEAAMERRRDLEEFVSLPPGAKPHRVAHPPPSGWSWWQRVRGRLYALLSRPSPP